MSIVYMQNNALSIVASHKARWCHNKYDMGLTAVPSTIRCVLQFIFELSHFSAVPLMLSFVCNLCKRMSWSIVLKAADRSSIVRMASHRLSSEHMTSLCTRKIAISTMWPTGYTDWYLEYKLLSNKYLWSWLDTGFKINLDMTEQFYTCLYFCSNSGSR